MPGGLCPRRRPPWRREFWNAPGRLPRTDRRTGARANWRSNLRSAICAWRVFGPRPDYNLTGSAATWPAMIRSSKRKRPTSLDFISNRRPMRRFFAWMKRRPSRLWIGWIRCCRCRQGGPNGMALSISATGRFRSTRPLNTQTGVVAGKTAARHTSAEFVAFLSELTSQQPRDREMHVIADNLSAHKTERVKEFLKAHPQVHLHFTPAYCSWLNQVELWFSKIERDVIARGVFTSVKDLSRKLLRYIQTYNRQAKPFKWTYKNTRNRIKP